ncbi:MAG: 50S ribosomal protein L25/general stress protein Ctc [Schleiferiaceae bacterium]|jgi:large subunit ribosomal protein L25|nr:50S ribosomal protein L25/general stress protein Ctc [Schleiferiaceae bacterium]
MISVAINATEREDLGGKFARKLRKQGEVPCVVYGGEAPVHFSAPTLAFRELIYTPLAKKAAIEVGGKTVEAIVQDIQFHPVTDEIMHIDFIELVEGKPVVMAIPVFTTGVARGVRNGGKQVQNLRKLRVKAVPASLPDQVEINVEKLRIGQSVRVQDLKTDGFEILEMQTAVVVGVRMARGAADEEEEEEDEAAEGAEASTEEAPAAE